MTSIAVPRSLPSRFASRSVRMNAGFSCSHVNTSMALRDLIRKAGFSIAGLCIILIHIIYIYKHWVPFTRCSFDAFFVEICTYIQ